MMRVTTLYAATAATTACYYTRYLTEATGELPGQWLGNQADRLRLHGEVTTEALQALLSGCDPVTGAALGHPLVDCTRPNGKVIRAVAGFDATLSAPKSLSVLWALTGDDGLAECHDVAVRAVAAHLERYGATTRVRSNGTRMRLDTHGLTMAAFRQTTSRADDPQLHTHLVVARVLEDETGMSSDTVAKLVYEWSRPDRPPDPWWQYGPGTTVVVDEAAARLQSTKTQQRTVMTVDDVRAVMAAAASIDAAAELAFRIAAVAGARRAELASLRWTDEQGGQLLIDSSIEITKRGDGAPELREAATKTANVHTVTLDADTVAMIDKLRRGREPYGPWMCGLGPELLSPDRISWWWKRARQMSGIDPKWRLHDLRHWSATVAIGQGHDVRTVAGRLGHANPAMTLRIYAHAFVVADQAVAAGLGEILKGDGK